MDIDYSKANISTLAKMFGLHRHTVRAKIDKAGLKPLDKVSGTAIFGVSEFAQVLYSPTHSDQESEIDPDKLDPADQRDYWHAKQKKQEYLSTIRTYIHEQDVTTEFADLAKRLKEGVQSFPDKAETEYGATPEEVERLILLCDSLQEMIYSEFAD